MALLEKADGQAKGNNIREKLYLQTDSVQGE
jgi:hypothetical protein